MINGLRAKPPKKKDIIDGMVSLKHNTAIQLDNTHNGVMVSIHEDNEDEDLVIQSIIDNGSFAMIGNEFKLNLFDDQKAVDFSYVFFADDKRVRVLLYDMKKTLAGIDVILKLIEQWNNSICTVRGCLELLRGQNLDYMLDNEDIQFGVITENNDIESRRKDLESNLQNELQDNDNSRIPGFLISKHKASRSRDVFIYSRLKDFNDGIVSIQNHKYEFDIREFTDKKCFMRITNGILLSQ